MTNVPLVLAWLCGGVFILIFAIIGIVMIIANARARKRAGDSITWPTIAGRILVSEVRSSQSRDEDGNLEAPLYYPYLEYEYMVDGHSYLSKKLAFGSKEKVSKQAEAQAKVDIYPEGADVTVFYNPQKPGDAVLERVAPKSKAGMIVGVIFVAVSACGVLGVLISAIINLAKN